VAPIIAEEPENTDCPTRQIGKKGTELDSDLIFQAVMRLPEEERFALASRIMETFPSEDVTLSMHDPELAEELRHRLNDGSAPIPWSELRAEG
jgi:hypothetical protein